MTDMLCPMVALRDEPKMTDRITPTSLAADIKTAVEWGEYLRERPDLLVSLKQAVFDAARQTIPCGCSSPGGTRGRRRPGTPRLAVAPSGTDLAPDAGW